MNKTDFYKPISVRCTIHFQIEYFPQLNKKTLMKNIMFIKSLLLFIYILAFPAKEVQKFEC